MFTPISFHACFYRMMAGIFDDGSMTPLMVQADGTPEHMQPLPGATGLFDDAITGVGQEFDNVKDFRDQLCKYAIGKVCLIFGPNFQEHAV